jgi:hypothetical protein
MRQGPTWSKLRKDGMRPVIQRSQGGSLIVVQYCRKDPNINKAPCRCQRTIARIKAGRARSRHQATRCGFCKENCLHGHNLGYLGTFNFGYTGERRPRVQIRLNQDCGKCRRDLSGSSPCVGQAEVWMRVVTWKETDIDKQGNFYPLHNRTKLVSNAKFRL